MARVSFQQADGGCRSFDVADGVNLMQAATLNGIDGIVAECGGNCMCATCHVYVEPAQLGLLPAMSEDEDALLDGTAAERRPNSRLSCQVTVTPALDGLVVFLPDRQV